LTFPIPVNEPQRLAALRALEILDTPPEIAYDDIAELAAQLCGCPVAYVSFIDDDRRWLKAKYGLPPDVVEAPREGAVCATTICGVDVLVVPDMTQDSRFDRNPMVVGPPYCRFYCGIPLINDDGYALGALCVMDIEPRQLSFEQIESMRRLSRQALTQLELRRRLIEHAQMIKQLDQAHMEVATEKARAEELLDNLLPAPIADELRKTGRVQPKYTRSATILFADFQGFTLLAERTEPATLIGLLDQYFTTFDDIIARHKLERVKTIGDAYMVIGGVPETDRRHPIDACLAALEMQAAVARIKSRSERARTPALELRIGIHTGPVISGVVGNRRLSFDIWGDAVNTASFIEACCPPGRINLSDTAAGHAKALFEVEPRGVIEVKHARVREMFFLNRLKAEFSRGPDGRMTNEKLTVRYGRFANMRDGHGRVSLRRRPPIET
jgi:adenylate cyclase